MKGKIYFDIRERMSDFEAAMAWNKGSNWKKFKSLIKFYFSWFLFHDFNYYTKRLSKVSSLLMWVGDMLDFEAAMALNRRITCQNLKSLIIPYMLLFCYCYKGHKQWRTIQSIKFTMTVIHTMMATIILQYQV